MREPISLMAAGAFAIGFLITGPVLLRWQHGINPFVGVTASMLDDPQKVANGNTDSVSPSFAAAGLQLSGGRSPGANTIMPLAPLDCRARTLELGDWLRDLTAEGKPIWFDSDLELADVDEPPTWDVWGGATNLIIVGAKTVRFRGQTLGSVARVREWDAHLRHSLRKWRRQAGSDDPPARVVAMVDRRAPWRAVLAIAAAVRRAGYHKLLVLVRGHSGVRAPTRSSIRPQLATMWKRAAGSAATPAEETDLSETVFASCPEARTVLYDHRNQVARDKWIRIAGELPAALRQCRCRVEPAAVRDLFWTYLGRYEGVLTRAVTLELDHRKPLEHLPGDLSWAEALAALQRKTGN
jgi:hypothetical protein